MGIRSHSPLLRLCTLLLLLMALRPGDLSAQKHLLPPHNGDGVPGPAPHSFIIAWAPVRGAIAYEYVLTDNEFCFLGCSGDTRNRIVADTFAVEYDMQENIDYYWITRIHLENGDTTQWTLISSFRSINQALKPLVNVAPNPVEGEIRLLFDWAATPDARSIVFSLFDLDGRQRVPDQFIPKRSAVTRFESHAIPVNGLPAGLYLANLRIQATGDAPVRNQVIKLVIR